MEFSSASGTAGFRLEVAPGGLVEGALWGALDEALLQRLEASLQAPGASPTACRRLLLRLAGVTGCPPEAQARWTALHRALARAGWRTAYLDPRPWGRGLVLAVVHRAGDGHALAVGSAPQAHAWLAAQGTRLEAAQALAEAGPGRAAEGDTP